MTGIELLAEAKKHFPVLYGGAEDHAYEHLVTQALGAFQDKAGYMGKIQTQEGENVVDLPPGFLSVISVQDAEAKFHDVVIDKTEGNLTVFETATSVQPYTIYYFVNLRDYNLDTDDLPPEAIGVLLDYLVALIDIPNTARSRRVAMATGQQIEVRSDEELLNRKQMIEDLMAEEYAVLPMVTV